MRPFTRPTSDLKGRNSLAVLPFCLPNAAYILSWERRSADRSKAAPVARPRQTRAALSGGKANIREQTPYAPERCSTNQSRAAPLAASKSLT